MRTIDEAIKHEEKLAEELEEEAVKYCCDDTEIVNKCYEYVDEHRQLADWMRELKAYREVEEVIFNICKENCEYPKDKPVMCGACWVGTIKDIFENLLDEFREVNADEDSD